MALVAAAAGVLVSGCYPGLPVIRPSTSIKVVDSRGMTINGADVTIATFKQPFPFPRSTIRATYRTDEGGVLSLKQKRRWRLQLLLADGFGWYTWLYCIEAPGYRAVASSEINDRIGPITVALQATAKRSVCEWPGYDEHYSQVEVIDE